MADHTDRLERVRIASPCPANWEHMSGDDRVRFCDLCNLHVYNIARLTRKEAGSLIANTEGRICARLFRRSDGTVITKDCPVGLRAVRRRVAKVGAAACTAILSVCSSAFPRERSNAVASCQQRMSIWRNARVLSAPANWASVSGTITDPSGAVIEGAIVTLINLKTNQKQVVKSDRKGEYRLVVSEFGPYTIKVEAPYFHRFESALSLHLSDDMRVDVALQLGALMGEVVIVELPRKGYDLDGVHVRINEE